MSTDANEPAAASGALEMRACPFCSTGMDTEATLCTSCGRFSRPFAAAPPLRPKAPILERANVAIAEWESAPQIQSGLKRLDSLINLTVPRSVRLGAGAVLLLMCAAMALLWLRYGGWTQAQAAFGLLVTSIALFMGTRVLRPDAAPVVQPIQKTGNDVSIHLLGYDINVALLQSVAIAGMVVWAIRSEIDEAWYAALAAIALTPLLWSSSWRRLSLAFGTVALLYVAYLWIVYDYLYLVLTNNNAVLWSARWAGVWLPVSPYVWTLLLVATIPQVQWLNVGGIGPGRLRGDFSVRLFGTDVPVGITSSLVLVSIWLAAEAVFYVPRWLPTALFG